MKNWVYYMQRGLKYMWKKRKVVPNWSKKDALDSSYDVKKDDDKKITVFDT